MTVKFELEEDELTALMQCASAGAAAAQALLNGNARPMMPIFVKIHQQFNDQRPLPANGSGSRNAVNGGAGVDTTERHLG